MMATTARVLLYAVLTCVAALLLVPLVRRRLQHLRGQTARPLFALVNVPGLLLVLFGFGATLTSVGGLPGGFFDKRVRIWNRTEGGTLVAVAWQDAGNSTLDLGAVSLAGRAEVFTRLAPGERRLVRYGYEGFDRRLCVLGFSRRGWWPSRRNVSLEWATRSVELATIFDVELRRQEPAEATVGPVSPALDFHIKAIVGPGSVWAPKERIWASIRTRSAWEALRWATPAILSMAYLILWACAGLAAQVRRTLPRNGWKSTGMVVALLLGGLLEYRLIAGILVPITKALMILGLRL